MSQRAGIDATESLVEDLLASTSLLLRRMRTETNPQELTWSQSSALGRLFRHGPATTADLARAEGVKPQSMGATLAGLERDGLVSRTPDPSDGRQAIYDLTPLGVETRASRRLLKRQWLAAAMTALDEREKEALAVAVRVIHRLGSG